MRAINPVKYTDEVDGYLKRLCVVDPYRCGYYGDLGTYLGILHADVERFKSFALL